MDKRIHLLLNVFRSGDYGAELYAYVHWDRLSIEWLLNRIEEARKLSEHWPGFYGVECAHYEATPLRQSALPDHIRELAENTLGDGEAYLVLEGPLPENTVFFPAETEFTTFKDKGLLFSWNGKYDDNKYETWELGEDDLRTLLERLPNDVGDDQKEESDAER